MKIPSEAELIEMEQRFRELANDVHDLATNPGGLTRNELDDLAEEVMCEWNETREDFLRLIELARAGVLQVR